MYWAVVIALLACAAVNGERPLVHANVKAGGKCQPERKTYSREMMEILKSMQEMWPLDMTVEKLTPSQIAWFMSINSKWVSHPLTSSSAANGNRSTISEIRMPEVWPTSVRKEYRQLSGIERDRFHRALQAMKRSYPDPLDRTTSEYDIFVKKQRWMEAPAAHFGAAFLPWHREFLWRFEAALQAHEPMVSLPYWDSTLDQTLPNPADSAIWTANYLGNNDGTVRSGPFAFWSVIPSCQNICGTLKRNTLVGNCCPWPRGSIFPGAPIPRAAGALKSQSYFEGAPGYPKTKYAAMCPPQTPCDYLFSDADIDHVLHKNKYSSIVANADAKFENDHDLVHAFVGGHMRSIDCAPSDPVYWLTSAFVDCVWEKFRQESQTPQDKRQTEYPRLHIGGSRHQAHAPMRPFWPLHNVHGLSDHYTNYYYECAPRPINCIDDRQCESDLLWCDRVVGRCRAKVRQEGICTGLPDAACAGPCEWGLTPKCLGRAEVNGQRCVCAYPNTRRPVFK